MIFERLAAVIWSPPLFLFLLAIACYLTLKLGCIQLRGLPRGLKEAFGHQEGAGEGGEISPFQSLMTSLASTIGTGNIAGIATAIVLGGPGAILWLWLAALLLMVVKYSEGLLAIKYRRVDDSGSYHGGPMYYIRYGAGKPLLAAMYAVCCLLATFSMGNMVQSNGIAIAARNLTGIPPLICGILVTVMVGAILIGGIRRIGRIAGVLTPFMAATYFLGCASVLVVHYAEIPAAFCLIVQSAFCGAEPVAGGFGGATVLAAIRFGVSRGVFANEAGLGNGAIAAAAARTDSCVKQGLVAMTGTFLTTLVVCTVTALAIVLSGVYLQMPPDELNGVSLTAAALSTALPGALGSYIVNGSLILFAFTSIIGSAYYGETCCRYLWGHEASIPFKICFSAAVLLGTIIRSDSLWYLSDLFNAMMMALNVYGIFLLRRVVIGETLAFNSSGGKGRSRDR